MLCKQMLLQVFCTVRQVQICRHIAENVHAFVSALLHHRHTLPVSQQQQLQQQLLLWLADTHKHAHTHSQQV